MKKILFILFTFLHLIGTSQISSSLSYIYFDFDSYKLSTDSKSVLDVEFESMNETTEISLTGYTDTLGSVNYNLKLSNQRCMTIKDYLISKGIKPNQFTEINGKGEQNKYSSNAKNRIVEVSFFSSVIMSPPLLSVERVLPPTDSIKISPSANTPTIQPIDMNDISTLEVGQTLALPNLSFIPGRHFLMFGSEETLKQLVQILKDNPTILIEIQGHICCMSPELDGLDKDTQTMNLSVNRAEYVYNYLIKNGISPYRLTFKGYGASKPLVYELTDEDRQKNRRVEIMIVDN